jgi:hypothetical protein
MSRLKPSEELGDFTTTVRVLPISLMAIAIGLISSGVAWLLLKLIGLFTNLFYYQRVNTALSSPAGNHLGAFAVAVPASHWFSNRWPDGPLWIGTHSRARHSRSH